MMMIHIYPASMGEKVAVRVQEERE